MNGLYPFQRSFWGFALGIAVLSPVFAVQNNDKVQPTPIDEEFLQPISDETKVEVEHLRTALGSPLFSERERATQRLREIGVRAFVQLREAYRETDDLEVRLRIERIVYDVFFDYHVYNRNGFLGVEQLRPPFPTHQDHPRIARGNVGIMIARVLDGTAAQKARLSRRDIIVEVNREPIPSEPNPAATFGNLIRKHRPGESIMLTILRGKREVGVKVTIGQCPRALVEQGRIQAVSALLVHARARFGGWWIKHFRHPSPESPSPPARPVD